MEEETSRDIIDRVVEDVGGAFATGLAYIGDRLGLFRLISQGPPGSGEEIARRAGLEERYVREWLNAMVAAGYLELREGRYSMTEAQKAVLADEDSSVFAAGAFQFAIPSLALTERLVACFREGGGIPYRELDPEIPLAIDRMHRPWFDHHLTTVWLPAAPGLTGRLAAGIRVLDVGCGLGRSTLALARAWPASRIVGLDPDAASIAKARELAKEANLGATFLEAALEDLPERDTWDLVVAIDCVHDMADPVGALAHIRRALAPGGRVFWSEPTGSADPTENRGPVEKMRAALSPYHCLTVSLAENGAGLGTIIGEDGARRLASEAGFTDFVKLDVPSRMQQFFLLSGEGGV